MDLDERLDERLHAAAPTVSARTPEMRRALDDLVVAATPLPRPRRAVTRAALMAAATVGVLGAGTAAAAAGLLPGWSLLTGSGQTCQVEVAADARHPGDGEPGPAFGATEQARTLAAARVFLQGFDYDSIDRDAAIAGWQADERAAITGEPDPAERQPALTGDDLEVSAVLHEVTERLRSHLSARELDLRAVSIVWSSTGCDL